jgi:HTH-type transcriptional regulator / antitoxin HigA
MRKVKSVKRRRDPYLALVQFWPLRPLRSEAELDNATKVVNMLLDQERLDEGEQDYLDVLADLIERYEQERHPIAPCSDGALLAYLLELRSTRQNELARATGIAASTISEVLADKRQLTRAQIEKVAAHFDVAPGVFLGGA